MTWKRQGKSNSTWWQEHWRKGKTLTARRSESIHRVWLRQSPTLLKGSEGKFSNLGCLPKDKKSKKKVFNFTLSL